MHARHKWKYKNLTILTCSIIIGYILSQSRLFHDVVLAYGHAGLISIYLAGMLFSSTFTVSIGLVMLVILAEVYSPLTIALIAGLGGLTADIVIFKFIKDSLFDEIQPLYKKFGGKHLTHLLHSKYFHWTLPVIGALIIASPIPDEFGITLMGISKMNSIRFAVVSYAFNVIGMFTVAATSVAISR